MLELVIQQSLSYSWIFKAYLCCYFFVFFPFATIGRVFPVDIDLSLVERSVKPFYRFAQRAGSTGQTEFNSIFHRKLRSRAASIIYRQLKATWTFFQQTTTSENSLQIGNEISITHSNRLIIR